MSSGEVTFRDFGKSPRGSVIRPPFAGCRRLLEWHSRHEHGHEISLLEIIPEQRFINAKLVIGGPLREIRSHHLRNVSAGVSGYQENGSIAPVMKPGTFSR